MANPYSKLTWLRFHLAHWLDPYPDRGEAWCIGCVLNGGRTLVLNADGHTDHMRAHRNPDDPDKTTTIAIRANYGPVPPNEDP